MQTIKRNCVATALALVLSGIGTVADAGETYYRWLDSQGNPVNSDRPPPPGIDYEMITTGGGLLQPSSPETKRPTETVAPPEPEMAPAATAKEQPPAKNPEACKTARQNLETLTTHARIRIRDSEGLFRFLTEDEITTQRELAEATIAKECE